MLTPDTCLRTPSHREGLTHIHGVEEMVKDLEGGQRALTAKFAARRCRADHAQEFTRGRITE